MAGMEHEPEPTASTRSVSVTTLHPNFEFFCNFWTIASSIQGVRPRPSCPFSLICHRYIKHEIAEMLHVLWLIKASGGSRGGA